MSHHNIRIDAAVYAAILKAKADLEAKTGKVESMSNALRSILGLSAK